MAPSAVDQAEPVGQTGSAVMARVVGHWVTDHMRGAEVFPVAPAPDPGVPVAAGRAAFATDPVEDCTVVVDRIAFVGYKLTVVHMIQSASHMALAGHRAVVGSGYMATLAARGTADLSTHKMAGVAVVLLHQTEEETPNQTVSLADKIAAAMSQTAMMGKTAALVGHMDQKASMPGEQKAVLGVRTETVVGERTSVGRMVAENRTALAGRTAVVVQD